MTVNKCQSCRRNEAEVVDPQDNPDTPYRVCKPCHQRMVSFSLRPLEYFNLKALHGDGGFVHDDMYDEKGNAEQPDYPVFEDHRLRFPTLEECEKDIERTIDYSIVANFLTDDVVQALAKFNEADLLIALEKRLLENAVLAYRVYEIVGTVLGSFAADWVRSQIFAYSNTVDEDIEQIGIYSQMLAKCLPCDEGFEHCVKVLSRVESSKMLDEKVWSLTHFHTPRSLHWIEQNIYRMESLSSSWGNLAAASTINWERVKQWLISGRPLSLVALDALIGCTYVATTPFAGEWLRSNSQKLYEPESVETMNSVLRTYQAIDNVPRTRKQIEFITNNWDLILKTDQVGTQLKLK